MAALKMVLVLWLAGQPAPADLRTYVNTLREIPAPKPWLASWPQFVSPIREERHFEAPPIIADENATLAVRAWRYSYHVRGIVEMDLRLNGQRTAIVVVHPWGIDDGQGWKSPEPAGTAFFCTPFKNRIYHAHVRQVLNPFLKKWRGHVRVLLYSLPGSADPIRTKLYRSLSHRPTEAERRLARQQLKRALASHPYRANPVPGTFRVSALHPTKDYFQNFPGLRADDHYNGPGFWNLPIPLVRFVDYDPDDVVFYDGQGYAALREFLKSQGIRHVLLAGYATDMCVCNTAAGYENLRQDFDVILVADATLATFPASLTPKHATTAAVARASMELLITEVGAIRLLRSPAVSSRSE